jgi:uncharacterized membrane protein
MPAPIFDAVLEPNPPLSPPTIFRLGCALAGFVFLIGLVFVLNGAWPVTPFLGLDIALLVWALRANARAAKRRERILLTSDILAIERIAPNGQATRQEIAPYWLSVAHEDREGLGADLALVGPRSQDFSGRVVVGTFLSSEGRAALADALRDAFHRLRNPSFG